MVRYSTKKGFAMNDLALIKVVNDRGRIKAIASIKVGDKILGRSKIIGRVGE